jgi:hypothetical protein
MATIVEHPMFSLGEIQNNLEGNPRRNSVEIIDVDAHDEPPASGSSMSQGPPRPRPALRPRHSFHPNSIISLVDDSDDEVQILSDPIQGRHRCIVVLCFPLKPVLSGTNRQETSNRRRLRSPPAYRFMPTPPPPVPSIPLGYASFTPLPAGRGAPLPFSAPPVRPNPQPFAFEQNLYQRDPSVAPPNHRQSPFLPRRTTVPQAVADPPAAAPPSHHMPSMGLGGALISSNNARAQLSAAQAARAARMTHAVRRRPMSWFVTAAPDFDELLFHDPVENPPHIRRWLENQRDQFVRLYQRLQSHEESQAKYYQRYTHPEQPEPGFTFDFAPNSSDEDSSRERRFPPTSANAPIIVDDDDEQSSTLLGGSFPSSKSPTANTEPGKLTAILICAKCTVPLLLNESLGPDDSNRRVWALRCGHMIDEQCLNDIGQPDEEAEPENQNQPETSVDRKGKGKATMRPKASYGEAVVEPIHSNNIRSRLRSAASTASSSSPSISLQPPPPTKRRRTTTTVRKVEAEFEWKCPVPSCELVHASVKIDGKWGPEKEAVPAAKIKARGAIPVFA